MGIQHTLGLRVADLRLRAHLTQAALAERVGVATETISRLERGASVPSLARVEQLATALGVPLSTLFTFQKPGSKDAALAALLDLVSARTTTDVVALVEINAKILARWR